MNLEPYVDRIQRQFAALAETGGDESRAVAERLAAPLDAAIRLTLQEALADAAAEITVELAPGSVELRLRSAEPEFVVTLVPAAPAGSEAQPGDDAAQVDWRDAGLAPAEGDETALARINLRMSEHVKARVERAAADEGISINSWLVRAAASALERPSAGPGRSPRPARGSQHYTGWAR